MPKIALCYHVWFPRLVLSTPLYPQSHSSTIDRMGIHFALAYWWLRSCQNWQIEVLLAASSHWDKTPCAMANSSQILQEYTQSSSAWHKPATHQGASSHIEHGANSFVCRASPTPPWERDRGAVSAAVDMLHRIMHSCKQTHTPHCCRNGSKFDLGFQPKFKQDVNF